MAKALQVDGLSEAQLEIMTIVWERGEVMLGDVWTVVSRRRSVAKNTVQTLLSRLVDKGWLRVREEGRGFRYRAAKGKSGALGGLIARLVEKVFRGSAEGLVLALLEGRGVSEEEASRIRSLIAEARRRK
jgi:BlaI family penicillinase repressor